MPETPAERVDYESAPLTRSEYIAALVHLYRGELDRANVWRTRLDATTNWAVLTTAGLLTFAFGPGEHTHWSLLMGLAVVAVFHAFEARRYRYWHVWRSRVRMIEENFYGPILRRELDSPDEKWGDRVARDLFHPTFKIGRLQALRARLGRNYWAPYSVLTAAWLVKVILLPPPRLADLPWRERFAEGGLPWWSPLLYLAVFLGGIALLLLAAPRPPESELDYWRHPERADADRPLSDL